MTPKVIIQLGLAIVGVVMFAVGVRTGHDWMRWTGLVLLLLSSLMRFLKPKQERP